MIFIVGWVFLSGCFMMEITEVVVDVPVPTEGSSPLGRSVSNHALPQHINAK